MVILDKDKEEIDKDQDLPFNVQDENYIKSKGEAEKGCPFNIEQVWKLGDWNWVPVKFI